MPQGIEEVVNIADEALSGDVLTETLSSANRTPIGASQCRDTG
ncbi:hypothetical protein QWY75_05670 [Pontixanthobacter aestiaquae]|nr:hypothetical protein [Pontixanthobacter aestiaquae]MDN3645693.1 hypothetical protein [Pontixanthobacter aestiaquae]